LPTSTQGYRHKAQLQNMKARSQTELTEQEREAAIKAFEGLGLCTQLAEAAAGLGWKQPTVIQQQAVPPLIQGNCWVEACFIPLY
jgi:superfamily II DNA/RNA helicase